MLKSCFRWNRQFWDLWRSSLRGKKFLSKENVWEIFSLSEFSVKFFFLTPKEELKNFVKEKILFSSEGFLFDFSLQKRRKNSGFWKVKCWRNVNKNCFIFCYFVWPNDSSQCLKPYYDEWIFPEISLCDDAKTDSFSWTKSYWIQQLSSTISLFPFPEVSHDFCDTPKIILQSQLAL